MNQPGRHEPDEQATLDEVIRAIGATRTDVRPGCLDWMLNGVAWSYAIVAGVDLLTSNTIDGWTKAAALPLWWVASRMRRLIGGLDAARAALQCSELGPGAAGALMQALNWPQRRVREVARLRLVTLLPGLSEADIAALTPTQTATLFDSLTRREARRNEPFVTAALRALPRLGNSQALDAARSLAAMPAWTMGLNRVRQQARGALPGLEQRILELRSAGLDAAAVARAGAGGRDSASTAAQVEMTRELVRRAEAKQETPMVRIIFVIAGWLVIVPGSLYLTWQAWNERVYWFVPVTLALGAFGTQLHRLALTGRHSRRALELARADDPSAVGPLVEALTWPEEGLRAVARDGLTRLLPRLKAGDGGLLSTSARTVLNGYLNRDAARSHPDFVIALLAALEQVGDTTALPLVQALAEMEARSARERHVVEAAGRCLPYLRLCADANQQSQTLLRAAHAPGPDADILVRPAQPGVTGDTALLVRPATGTDTNVDDINEVSGRRR